MQFDEPPGRAEGFDQPLVEYIALTVEPKKGIVGVGMVSSESTYVVTPSCGHSNAG